MKFKFLSHTADEKFRAFGKNLEEAFENAAYAMKEIITYDKIKPRIKKKIKIASDSEEALLYDFLEQLLILLDSKKFILSKVEKLKIERKDHSFILNASISGDNNPKNYEIKTSIKAVTYEEMFIRKTKNKVTVQVIVDI